MNYTPTEFAGNVAKGIFKPHIYLQNVCLGAYQNPSGFVARKMFPQVSVPLSSAHYYKFNKDDIARVNVAEKPELGHVAPMIYSKSDEDYKCKVYQVILGLDQIYTQDFARTNAPAPIDPRKSKARALAEQFLIFEDLLWADKFFNPNSWDTVYEGSNTPSGAGQIYYFDNANSKVVNDINMLKISALRNGFRKPNRMCVGINVFAGLQENDDILDRIRYHGSEANPANATEDVLARVFGVKEFVVAEGVVNTAKIGGAPNRKFVVAPNDVLLCYAPDAPAIDEPSAGYTFTWDMLGNGQHTAIQTYLGEPSTHTEFIEGLFSIDHRVTSSELGIYIHNAVDPGHFPS